MNKTATANKIIVAVLVLFFISGCVTTQKQWEQATEINSIQAYEEFLDRKGEPEYAGEAKIRLEKLYFDKALSDDTTNSYEKFLEKFPDSKYVKEIRSKFAKVVIDSPSSLEEDATCRYFYYITFREINGVGATIDRVRMRIYAKNGDIWGRKGDNLWAGDFFGYMPIFDTKIGENVTLELKPNGTASYLSWVGGFHGARLDLEYTGKDEKGHRIYVSVSITME